MKILHCLSFALLSLLLLNGCATSLNLQLNGQNRSDIMGHNRQVLIGGGTPMGGQYSGPGVENGFFVPAKAGNGTHEITYSKLFYRPATAKITVYGAPEPPKPCVKCKGKRTILCPSCQGRKEMTKGISCKKCHGRGIIPCPLCNVVLNPTTDAALLEVLKVFTTCRLELARKNHIVSLSGVKYDEISNLKPSMLFYTFSEQKTVLATGEDFKELSPSSQDYSKVDSAHPVSFTFVKKLSLLEEKSVSIIMLKMTYGRYEVKLFYDLRDVMEDDGELLRTHVYPRVLCFQGKFYRLPFGLFALDSKNIQKQTNGKNWRDVEECENWHYQENAKKGYVQIIDDRNFIVFSSEEASQRVRNDEVWILVKEWLVRGKDGFWKSIANKPIDNLEKALNGSRK